MKRSFELLAITRKNFVDILEETSPEILFTIPEGFNNHIFWNIIHVVASQQLLVYGLSQTPFRIDKDIIFQFKTGTVPTETIDTGMIQFAKDHLLSTIDQLSEDYQNGIFGDPKVNGFKPIKTSYGMPINKVEDAIEFCVLHEAMHYGQIKMMQKVLAAMPVKNT